MQNNQQMTALVELLHKRKIKFNLIPELLLFFSISKSLLNYINMVIICLFIAHKLFKIHILLPILILIIKLKV